MLPAHKIEANPELVAYCGLYCGACRSYLKGKCPGCRKNEKASWCKVRTCCTDKNISSCASCDSFDNLNDCKKFNNIFAKFFELVFRSDRIACIRQIRAQGLDIHAKIMAENKQQTTKKS